MSDATRLMRLQEIDIALLRIENQLKKMPEQERLAKIADAKKRISAQLSRVLGERKDVEMEIEELEERHTMLENKVAEVRSTADERVRNYRQVNDLEAQLTSLAKKIEKCEFELGPLMDRLEALKASENHGIELATALDAQEEAQREQFRESTVQMREEVQTLLSERNQLVGELDENLMYRYDKARKRFSGLAVESLKGNVPTICRVKLQPGAYQELMRGPVISECPYCHRILVTEEASDD